MKGEGRSERYYLPLGISHFKWPGDIRGFIIDRVFSICPPMPLRWLLNFLPGGIDGRMDKSDFSMF